MKLDRIRRRIDSLDDERACLVCAPRPFELIVDIDVSPHPPEDTRPYDELCRLPMIDWAGHSTCPRCGGATGISTIVISLHPALRHADHSGHDSRTVETVG